MKIADSIGYAIACIVWAIIWPIRFCIRIVGAAFDSICDFGAKSNE